MAALFLLNSLQVGGSEAKTVRIVNALCGRGRPVFLGCLNLTAPLRSMVDEKVPVIDFNRRGKFDPKVVSGLGDCIRKHRIRMVLCVNLYPTLYGVIAQTLNRRQNVECISLINVTEFASPREAVKMIIYRPALRRAARLVFGCRAQQDLWISRYGLDSNRCIHIYNGVDLERFSPLGLPADRDALRKSIGCSADEIVIVSVAQFRREKKQGDLIAACSLLCRQGYPVRLVLVGDGPERSRLLQEVEKTGAGEFVRFLGQIEDVRPILGAGDIFALSSVAVETFSNAALEAMAMGMPVVLSDIGGAAEMVREEVNGYLYPPGDVPALAQKLALLAKDAAARERMALQARRMVQERFSFETMLQQYAKLMFPPEDYARATTHFS